LSQLDDSAALYDAAIRHPSLQHKEGGIMVLRLYAVACIALSALLLGGNGIAHAGDTDDSYSHPQSDDSYAKPDTAEEPAQPNDAAPPQEDDSAAPPDDSGGDDANAPPATDEPE
jgi:hypothetical protein